MDAHARVLSPELPEIDDNSLFTGREVKRLLKVVSRDSSPYVKIREAAEISGTNRSTLKSAAPRYYSMMQAGECPLIRVRRTSSAKGAHWLFHEGDCWAARRERGTVDACGPSEPQAELVAHYVWRTTSNL
jgi:hypothetical protein